MADKIVVLSSTPEVTQRLRDTLEQTGYRLNVLPAATDLTEAVLQHRPDLAIIVPGLGQDELRGYESRTLKRLREAVGATSPRVLVLALPLRNLLNIPGGWQCDVMSDGSDMADMSLFESFDSRELFACVRRLIGSPGAGG